MSKKKALGRGLSALLKDNETDEKLEVDIPVSSAALATPSTPAPGPSTEVLMKSRLNKSR
jgi:ParB family transcriptional regulator, chromosome partitioning protein